MSDLGHSISGVFDELKRRLDALMENPERDNEATRHDRLVLPVLTHELLLGWDHVDVVAQPTITTPHQLRDSYCFRDAVPKFRKPDLLVTSNEFNFNAFVVEEKQRQKCIADLNGYRLQLHEYQGLFECAWGLLTDGQRWILKRGFESYHVFDSLDELRSGLGDLQHCVGKQSVVQRYVSHGTCDLVFVIGCARLAGVGCALQPSREHLVFLDRVISAFDPKSNDFRSGFHIQFSEQGRTTTPEGRVHEKLAQELASMGLCTVTHYQSALGPFNHIVKPTDFARWLCRPR